MSDIWQTSLINMISHLPADELLLLGTDALLLQSLCKERQLESRCITQVNDCLASLADDRRLGCVVLVDLLASLEKADGLHLLARLRDIHARQLIVVNCLPGQGNKSSWQQGDFLSMGMQGQGVHVDEQSQRTTQLYRWAIKSYKSTPDWLNSKYWANPQLFGKYRW